MWLWLMVKWVMSDKISLFSKMISNLCQFYVANHVPGQTASAGDGRDRRRRGWGNPARGQPDLWIVVVLGGIEEKLQVVLLVLRRRQRRLHGVQVVQKQDKTPTLQKVQDGKVNQIELNLEREKCLPLRVPLNEVRYMLLKYFHVRNVFKYTQNLSNLWLHQKFVIRWKKCTSIWQSHVSSRMYALFMFWRRLG